MEIKRSEENQRDLDRLVNWHKQTACVWTQLNVGDQHWAKLWKYFTREVLCILLTIAVVTIVTLSVKLHFAHQGTPAVPLCPEGWIGYLGKCYYFSEAEGNWAVSQSNCSSFSASLAVIDTMQEKVFMLRYKGLSEHWIGLQREEGQPWRWMNGAEFNNLFEVKANGKCAYLIDAVISSSWCHTLRNWICTKRDTYMNG